MCGCGRRVGDLGNVQPDSEGRVMEKRSDRLISLYGRDNIIDRVVDVSSYHYITTYY